MPLFLLKSVDLYERPQIKACVGNKVGRSLPDDPVRVLACVPPSGKLPGYCKIEDSHERMEYLHEHTLDLVQVGEPPNVGFALVPRKHLVDTPF